MIFHKIVLNNLFSYKGEQVLEFDLSAASERRVVLIMGRNGFGKTSLLNSVKLLFLGADDKSQRRVGFPSIGLSRNAYLCGDGASWAGVMNRQARRAGKTDCSVRVEMGSPGKVELIIERRWDFSVDPVHEYLEVHADGESFAGSEGEIRLDEFLPRELVPFFFFDGEEIQFLAESSDIHRSAAMERLLSLSFVNGVEAELAELTKKWRRAELPGEVQANIREFEGRQEAIKSHIEADTQKDRDLSEQEREVLEEAASLQHRMETLRKSGLFSMHSSLDEEIAELGVVLQQEQNDLAYSLAVDAPLIANPSLIRLALEPLQESIERKSESAQSVIDTLFKVLPERIFEEPPQPRVPLTTEQQEFYVNKLRKILDAFNVVDSSADQFLESLDVARLRQLYEQFLGLATSMKSTREDRARRLREISRKKKQLDDKRAEWRELEFGTSEGAEQYEKLEKAHVEKQRELGELRVRLEDILKQQKDREAEQRELEQKVLEFERQRTEAERTGKRLEIAHTLRETFRQYRRKRREAKREQIEENLNKHFSELMSGHGQIDKITLDQDFFLKYVDKSGQEIGHSTISHGMRQLVVTSLLWALKEASGRSLPIIVDTPLARIDRENQENLLAHYYPSAAEQVIILATDSEVDDRKFELIRPQLAQVLKLDNPDGETSTVQDIPIAEGTPWSGAVAHG